MDEVLGTHTPKLLDAPRNVPKESALASGGPSHIRGRERLRLGARGLRLGEGVNNLNRPGLLGGSDQTQGNSYRQARTARAS